EVSGSPRDSAAPTPADRKAQRRRRWRRIGTGLAIATPLVGVGLWIAVHRIPWMGPAVANGLRALVGTDNVARLEDFVYAVEDRVNRLWRKNEAPTAYWEVPPEPAVPPAPPPKEAAEEEDEEEPGKLPPFAP